MDVVAVASRAYCRRDKSTGNSSRYAKAQENLGIRAIAPRPDFFIAFDTETATDRTRLMPGFDGARWNWQTQNLLFGVARIGTTANMDVTDEIIFYPDDLPDYGIAILKQYIEEHTFSLGPPVASQKTAGYIVNQPEREKSPIPELRWRDEPDVAVWLMRCFNSSRNSTGLLTGLAAS